jgi:hypothetical protein
VPARARTFATGPGGAQATGAPLALAPGATVRLRATVRDGALEAAVSTDGTAWVTLAALPRDAAGAGQAPTRAGASCRGRGAGRFAWMVARRPG